MSTQQQFNLNKSDEMIFSLYNDLNDKGYQNVCSVLYGESAPEKIYCEAAQMFFCPDLYAEKSGIPILFQVVTDEALTLSMTRAEIACLLSYIKIKRGYFYLVVPEGAKALAETVLRDIENYDCHRAFVLPM